MSELRELPMQAREMRVLAGLQFGGPTLTQFDDRGTGRGAIGEVVWSPRQLLRDLELRLGLGIDEEEAALREAAWAKRMAELAPLGRYRSSTQVIGWVMQSYVRRS